ncbi:glycosyltransferase family 2 protein [Sphingomonas oryzagri]|uniref:Glycosyltransferase n=1 Tax=Sphingomonas oryzagri TaxID=3042314 RepID=A0ABT6MYS7_9SPHN|nr:glycosyltransferase [Sphingomonas oryzagri]MDH7638152.1 glycosyltransferase [Sphingomonas oryzagri]
MSGVSVLTIVRNREAHLQQLAEGLRRSGRMPDELVVVDMSDDPARLDEMPFPVIVERLDGTDLPLAKARNRAASLAQHEHLLFLDVDCIPMAGCIDGMLTAMHTADGVVCADVRYLGPGEARGDWSEAELMLRGKSHPVRTFPASGIREERNPGLFWSLAFGIHARRFKSLGGFDEQFVGYGAEDTDFGFRAAKNDVPLYFVGGSVVCHQHHDTFEPPVQHVADIVRNANFFRRRWNRWPMEGWLRAFHGMGLVEWTTDKLEFRRGPTLEETSASFVTWPGSFADTDEDRIEQQRVLTA